MQVAVVQVEEELGRIVAVVAVLEDLVPPYVQQVAAVHQIVDGEVGELARIREPGDHLDLHDVVAWSHVLAFAQEDHQVRLELMVLRVRRLDSLQNS